MAAPTPFQTALHLSVASVRGSRSIGIFGKLGPLAGEGGGDGEGEEGAAGGIC